MTIEIVELNVISIATLGREVPLIRLLIMRPNGFFSCL